MSPATTAATTVTLEGDAILEVHAGDIGTLNANDGLIDFSKMVRSLTVTTATFNGAKAVARLGANGLTVTYTSATVSVPPDDGAR